MSSSPPTDQSFNNLNVRDTLTVRKNIATGGSIIATGNISSLKGTVSGPIGVFEELFVSDKVHLPPINEQIVIRNSPVSTPSSFIFLAEELIYTPTLPPNTTLPGSGSWVIDPCISYLGTGATTDKIQLGPFYVSCVGTYEFRTLITQAGAGGGQWGVVLDGTLASTLDTSTIAGPYDWHVNLGFLASGNHQIDIQYIGAGSMGAGSSLFLASILRIVQTGKCPNPLCQCVNCQCGPNCNCV